MTLSRKVSLRTGYTTGACAAAATKAALVGTLSGCVPPEVEIPFPDGSRHRFRVSKAELLYDGARATVIKDAGDDPDVTNGAEIVASVRVVPGQGLIIKGGKGIGRVTKPGLVVPVGEYAINPVPKEMLREAVKEALGHSSLAVEVELSMPEGEVLARKTINERLGIVGGLSILGTTGIVRPLSSEAWTATIATSMDVAKAVGLQEVVLCAGRASEEAHRRVYRFPGEAYVMMGDYLEFSLLCAREHSFSKIHLVAQWAKMLKCALAEEYIGKIKQPSGYTTHVRHGPVDLDKAVFLISDMGVPAEAIQRGFNTAREIFDTLQKMSLATEVFKKLCVKVSAVAETLTGGIAVNACLVGYDKKLLATTYDTL